MHVPFKKPYYTGNELHNIQLAMNEGHLGGDGMFTKKCNTIFKELYGFEHNYLTTSCTDALEMCALLADIKEGDEVIVPSYTFVATASAFALQGAKIVFADSLSNSPTLDIDTVEALITPRTKVLVLVHYAGICFSPDQAIALAKKHHLILIEDAAQAIDAYYDDKPVGSFGDLATFSFHDTKNVIAGEGGLLVVNNPAFVTRATVLYDKGTNRSAYMRGEVAKYEWIDIGSSFLASDIAAAFLYAQMEAVKLITAQRRSIWARYEALLTEGKNKGYFELPFVPEKSVYNGNIFYITCKNEKERNDLSAYLKQNGISATFHYVALHQSPYYLKTHEPHTLPQAEKYSQCLLRLPLYMELTTEQQDYVCEHILAFYRNK
jgi:dTDP-4-amino-4,6-dideoxygalactose transaminase